MSDLQNKPNSKRKIWITVAIIAACAIIGIIIWKMIEVNPHVV